MKINNHTNLDLTELEQQVDRFYPYSKQQLGFEQDPQSINFVSDPENATNMLGKTAFYDPESFSITIYADNRHPKDMMRSLSHELVHHAQNCRGEFDNEMDLGEGYAQEDEHMRNMEKEAYSLGNIVFRDWEDGMKKEVNEGYRGEDAVDNRSLKFKTAHKKKQWSPGQGGGRPGGGINKKNQAEKVIKQFGNDLTPEELDLVKIYQEREEITGELDTAAKNELIRIVAGVIGRKRRMGKMSEMIATPDTVKDAINTSGDEDMSELEEVSWQGVKDKVRGAVGMLPSARNAYKSPSGHVIWNHDRAEKGFFPWQLAKQNKKGMWVMIPNKKNDRGIHESPFMTQQEAVRLEDLGADGLSRLAGKIQVPWFKGQKAPMDWIKLVAKNPQAGFDGVYFLKGKQDFEGADKMMANLRQLQNADLEAQWAQGRKDTAKLKSQKKFNGSPGAYTGGPSAPKNVAISGSNDTQSHGFDAGDTAKWNENLTLREAKIMSKRNKLEEMVLEYCQTKNFKTLSEVKQVRKVVEKILKENKEKADIDDDGKVSGWEKARSDAIQKNMDKEKTDEGMMDKIKSKFKKKPDTRTDRQKNADDMAKGMVGIGESDDTANLYEAPVTEADLEEEIELEEAFSDLEEVMAMGMDDEQTGNTMAQAKKEAGRTYSKAGKEAALQAQKKSMGITEEEVVEEDALEEEQLQEKTKDTGPKSRDRDEPDRHHKPKMESRRIAAKKSASQINESKFDKKFHDLVKKWCK